MWPSQRRQIRQGLTLDGSNPEDEALPAAYVGALQRLAALKGEALRAAHRRHDGRHGPRVWRHRRRKWAQQARACAS
jgi:hypothetical protein